MFNMRRADPSRRTPTYLQAYTQENLVWQLKLTPVVILGVMAYGWWQDNEFEIKRKLKNRKSRVK